MNKLLSSPIFILGAVYVGYKMIKRKPTGLLSQTFDEIVEGSERIVRTVGKSATSIVDEVKSTGSSIADIYDDGALGEYLNEEWLDIETGVEATGEALTEEIEENIEDPTEVIPEPIEDPQFAGFGGNVMSLDFKD